MPTTKDDRHYTRTTTQETQWLEDLRVRHHFSSRSEAIRYCIQKTIEDESDAIGSRRNFSRTMNQKLDQIRQDQQVGFAMVILIITEMLTRLINLLQEDDEDEIELIDAGSMRIALYKKSVTNELIKIVNAVETIQKQQRVPIQKSKDKKK
jgi:Arc/MetJ-type ribon-helix-helix transcriptional regulator